MDMSNTQSLFVQVVHKPERLCIIKRGISAEDYFPYCEEVSCDVWGDSSEYEISDGGAGLSVAS